MNVKLSPKADERLRTMLNTYIEALRITVDALGLEGEWTYDPTTGSLISVEKKED